MPQDAGNLVLNLPAVPPDWQFLIDIMPAQLAAERLAQLAGVDCDSFRYSSFIIEDEYGLWPEENGSPNEKRKLGFTGYQRIRRNQIQQQNLVIGAVYIGGANIAVLVVGENANV